ncbi:MULTISPECIES: cupin domain-containing protein [unclassified Moritella]|uniref:cupin domain-containing protein n=1 Tax=unclassified Moritella TaxID=2637987 RepID=UPI001BA8C09B|nr:MULTISPECIES: cupin domain-containing protein [unclassified Moritella]QUM84003.1 cupin domain-containing protein [Moritella sp. 28]QUM88310.1 cupin domain-containing protein [Moritella sp. 36]
MYKLNLDIADFMENYWQKKPLLIKAGFKDFIDPISPDEIAGLAMEEEITSRMVSREDGKWEAKCGPFTDFERMEAPGAAILVQAINHWHDPSAELANTFNFIPSWRFDDLMVSYSTDTGGVGPHIDRYCVFIIQGLGKRHWRVGAQDMNPQEFAANGALKHCEAFDAVIDTVLEPGDILYIPPYAPHEGYAVGEAINYSVGFRAQDQKELLNDFGDYLLQQDKEFVRYSDPKLQPRAQHGSIEPSEVQGLTDIMTSLMADKSVMHDFLGRHYSESAHELDLVAPEGGYIADYAIVVDEIGMESYLRKVNGLKTLYFPEMPTSCFIDGERYDFDASIAASVQTLCNTTEQSAKELEVLMEDKVFGQLLIEWVNLGYWHFE